MKGLLVAISLFASSLSFGHAIWIETASVGKTEKQQEIKVFFGEYSENERDSAGHWFSDLGRFKLYVISPAGEKSEISTKETGNCYTGVFSPKGQGTYVFSIDHLVKDVYYESLIHYYATAITVVGNDYKGLEHLSNATALSITPVKENSNTINKNVEIVALYNNSVAKEFKFSVQPPLGWTKDFELNDKGQSHFKPYVSGIYMMEGFLTENTSGTHEGKEYKAIWHCVTHCVEIKK